ncbi:type II secretion system F family protein [Microbacterium awajiense]
MRPTPSTAPAGTLLRLAVLLEAGVAPPRAWEHLAYAGDPAARRVVDAVAGGEPVARAVAELGSGDDPSWRALAAAWQVAVVVGAPLAPSLRAIAAAADDARRAGDEVRVALAEPAATARLMGWLPAVGLALGVALGFDTVGVLLTGPAGWACLAAGAVLTVVGRRWSARLVRRAGEGAGIPGLQDDLLAIALSGGVSIDRARTLVVEATGSAPGADAPVLELSRRAGVPAVELLRATAALARHDVRTAGRMRAAQLASKLLLPLGVCTLPAFLLLGVAPMLLSVLTTTTFTL